MTRRLAHLKGRWRIVETTLWDRAHLDLVGPAFIALDGKGGGEMAFGALTAVLDCRGTSQAVDFTWNGADEGDQVSGGGSAELQPDGSPRRRDSLSGR
ncbi:MAG TPA: hypothetical protein VGR19_11200 [Allosphingosinicella sp.]|nr:hypothetical protein [Allosphingosinicella sp.]